MSESHFPDGSEGRVVDVREFADAAFGQRPVSFARFVGVPEKPNEQLIDANPRLARAGTSAQCKNRSVVEPHLMIMRNVFVPDAAIDRPIGASPEPAPAMVCVRIFGVEGEIDSLNVAQDCARDTKNKDIVVLRSRESLGRFAFAPPPAFPLARKTKNVLGLCLNGEE